MKKIIIGLLLLLFLPSIIGLLILLWNCAPYKHFPNNNQGGLNEQIGYLDECSVDWFEIEYVDKINIEGVCYAIKYQNPSEHSATKYFLKKSFYHIGENPHNYFFKQNITCFEIHTLGKAWCLRDNSTCLILEDHGRICDIIELEKK